MRRTYGVLLVPVRLPIDPGLLRERLLRVEMAVSMLWAGVPLLLARVARPLLLIARFGHP